MAKPWIEIIDDQRLEERVATERANADLFDGRLYCVTRPTFGLSEIINGPPKGKRSVALSLGSRVVAIAGVQVDPKNTKILWVTHVAVEEQHWGNGYGRAIVEAVYRYAIEHDFIVDPSSFSPMGKQRIEHIFAEMNVRYPQAACQEVQ